MKNVLKVVLPVLIFCFTIPSNAMVTKNHPKDGYEITQLRFPKIVVHNNVQYYRNNGIWYVKKNRRYRRVAAPIGVRVSALPRTYKIVRVRGIKYYKSGGVYYKKNGRKYIVVNV
ncbi:DUF6515 family protein [Aquimarina pacifica]|uniref:DUF6515 family protein n=1 Tax=Aquimarina pacifica TaxID=1296415 RepID=UPI00046F0B6B|nr:DUF6515 family protein [Aquimarina pacifica]